MKSNVSLEDRKALIELYRSMSPQKRLVAFLNHSRLLHKFHKAVGSTRLKRRSSQPRKSGRISK